MKIGQRTKEIIGVVYGGLVILGLAALLFAAAIKGYRDSIINLDQVDKFEGTVIDKDIVLKRGKINLNVFYFKLSGLSDRLASYNMKQDYKKLMDNINIGDQIQVYFKKSKSQSLNLDVIQIEKRGEIILDKNEFRTTMGSLIYIGTVGGVLMLSVFLGLMIKTRKTWIQPPKIL